MDSKTLTFLLRGGHLNMPDIYRAQRSYAHDSHLVAEQGEKVFTLPEDAAKWYLKWALHLPGDLDGWKVTA